ncbi:hypothetical protein JR316_0001847 [Psilocybe cubensis]|uniref:SWIM-type domain-containing protein n=2 Tax=Psilocybe cubensis TaxID=181762 RepID=A0A8H8CMX7_PSICU|nr:hypothetical protein JR316_0001847 [Psilocybe cubensis]KAH9484943.1 hypothetical protein JR316_0001847 [Psilocybe cubensis]
MSSDELLRLAKSVIQSIDPKCSFLSDETLELLNSLFPEKLIIAALDLIDRKNVIHYVTSWGHTEYEVIASTDTSENTIGTSTSSYSVLLDIQASPMQYSCSCLAFLHSVLRLETHLMCKHILAALIARQMNLTIERPTNPDELAVLFMRQFPILKGEDISDSNASQSHNLDEAQNL